METIMDWYLKDRIILYRPFGSQNLKIVQQSNDRFLQFLGEGKAPVHIILDARYITKVPTSILELSKTASFLKHPSVGWVITMSRNPLIRFLGGILPQIVSVKRTRAVAEPESALTFLKEQDSTLDWSNVNDALLPIDILTSS